MNLEERLDNIERQYITALAERDLKTAALEKELSELKAKHAENESNNASKAEYEAADYLLSKISVPDGSPTGATSNSLKNANF